VVVVVEVLLSFARFLPFLGFAEKSMSLVSFHNSSSSIKVVVIVVVAVVKVVVVVVIVI
jgi:hypothetical protein